MRSLFSLTVILYALSPFPAGAADAWTLIDTQRHDELARVDRLQIAADLIGRLDLLLAHIPRQSPREAEKVADRLATLDAPGRSTEHRGRFFLSTAYQHYQLVALLNDARSSLACATAATTEAAEMNCWARAADAYLAEERIDVGVATLRAARLLPRDDDMPRNAQDPRVWYTEFGRGILRRIITPGWPRWQPKTGSEVVMKLRKTVFLLTVSVGAATAGQASETVLLNESPAYLCYRQTQLDSRMPDVEQCDVAIEYQSLERVDLAATYMNRGILLARAGKLKAALADQDKAIAIAPEMSQGFINRSNVRVRMKQYAQAMQDLDTAVGIGDVALGVAYYNRALLFQKIGDLDAARHDARKASALAPESLEYAEYSRALDAVDTLTQ